MQYYKTTITAVGPEVEALLDGGVLILYADGAPAELAEVSVLHQVEQQADSTPPVGSLLRVGQVEAVVTAVGETAWNKVSELGHVVINFNGEDVAGRPGEICVEPVNIGALQAQLNAGGSIELVF